MAAMILQALAFALLSASPTSRPLAPRELLACPQKDLSLHADQSFELKADGWPRPVWVLSGTSTTGFRAAANHEWVRVVTPKCAVVSEIEAPSGELDGLAFYDLDADGRAEVVMLSHHPEPFVRLLGPRGPVLQELEKLLNGLGRSALTLPEIRELASVAGNRVKSVSCSQGSPPFAVTSDGTLGAFFDSSPIRLLVDDSVPKFVGARLVNALGDAKRRGCEMTMNPDVPHGSGLVCGDPVAEFNKLLLALEPPVEFAMVGDLGTEVAVGSVKVSLQALCGARDEKVVAVGRQGKTMTVYSVASQASLSFTECTADEQEAADECARSGGTCIHDVLCVPQATQWPNGTVTRVTLK